MEHLTKSEKELISAFVKNESQVNAVRKALEDTIVGQGVPGKQDRNWVFGIDQMNSMNNEEFGKAVRTRADALVVVEQAFNNMTRLAEPEEKKDKKNKAR